MPALRRASTVDGIPQKPNQGFLMDLRRKEQIIEARPIDHSGEVFEMENPDFDVSRTIFKHIDPSKLPMIKKTFGIQLFWSDSAVARIERKTAEMLAENRCWADLKAPSPELMRFMLEECDFNTEHADGSFLDHLHYCYEFSSVHMPNHSAIPMFLHSIMGVGTNLFPMKLEQKPRLAELVSAEDMVHIEAFPSMLRLLICNVLPSKLAMLSNNELASIEELQFYRLIGPNMDHDGLVGKSDNAPLKLNKEQFWVHLNYHLIHFTDFVPALDWEKKLKSVHLYMVVALHQLLKRAGKLYVRFDFDSDSWVDRVMYHYHNKAFSEKIGFRLEYKLKMGGNIYDSLAGA